MLNHNYISVPSKEKLQVWYDDNERILERMWKFSALQDYNQWMTLSFLDDLVTCIGWIITDPPISPPVSSVYECVNDSWITYIGWIITDHQSSCHTVRSVYECVNDGWVTCIGWTITDHQSSCYTVSFVYECVIKEGHCYWGSKTLLREIWNGEAWWRHHFGRRVPTMDLRGENVSKLNSRNRIDWLQMKRAR